MFGKVLVSLFGITRSGHVTRTGFVAELSAKSKWGNAETLMRDIYSCDIPALCLEEKGVNRLKLNI